MLSFKSRILQVFSCGLQNFQSSSIFKGLNIFSSIKEFRLIYEAEKKREHDAALELLKQKGRADLVELKTEKLIEMNNNRLGSGTKAIDTVPYTQESVISQLVEQKKLETEQQEKIVDAEVIT